MKMTLLCSKADLIKAAKEGMYNAFTGNDQQNVRFGAAVLTSKGNIYSAGQYFSDTLSLTLHAEQAAIAHAAAHGEYALAAITCIGNEYSYQMSGGIIYPCHLCKQLIWESYLRSGVNTEIFIADVNENIIEQFTIAEIMNYVWPLKKG